MFALIIGSPTKRTAKTADRSIGQLTRIKIMADASASAMHPEQPNSVALQAHTAEEISLGASSLGHATTVELDDLTSEEIDISVPGPCDSDRTRDNLDKQTAYVECVDTSDEDFDKTSISDYLQCSASASDANDWKDLPISPKVPWRRGGMWHLRSGNQRDAAHRRRATSTGSVGRPQSYPAQIDSDSDSSASVRDYNPNLHSEELEDTESDFGMGAWHEFLHMDFDNDSDRERPHGRPEEPLYPQGLVVKTECYVCFEESELRRRLCCDFPVCDRCLESYLMVQVLQANVNIECLNINCSSYIHRSEISARLPPKYKMKFYKFLIDANIDPTVKTCPRCSSGLQVDKVMLKKRRVVKNGLHVTCKRCGLDWCFTCHAPLHKGLTCKDYRKGDILLKEWAREFHYGQLNAQQCPKCKIFIQRSLGCDHMICTRCSTNFCYRCGENYRGIKLLGNHFSRFSPFGCRYNFLPDAPHLRRLIRGAVLGGKLLGGLVLSGFVVAAGACLLGVGIIALPAWGGYKLHKRRRFRQRLRANRKYAKQNLALRNLQAKKAAEISVPAFPMPVVDSSDSLADDSSDEVRDRLMVGLELPDSQRVEVLVHQTVSSSSDQEEGGACGGPREVVTDSALIVTDVQEVVNEGGYTTLVTNVYAKPKEAVPASASAGESSDESGEEYFSDEERSCWDSRQTERRASSAKRNSASSSSGKDDHRQEGQEKGSGKDGDCCGEEKEKAPVPVARTTTDCDCDDQLLSKHHKTLDKRDKDARSTQEKPEEKVANPSKEKKGRPGENAEKGDKKLSEPESCVDKREKEKPLDGWERSDKKPEKDVCPRKSVDQKEGDELSKESTNGCFGNIFSKKITVIQIGSRRNTDTQPDAQKPANPCYKSSTWEKSHEKPSHHKHKTSMDIQDLSCFREKLPLPSSDVYVKPAYEKGVLLQDFVVLSPPGDFSSERVRREVDNLSLASASSAEDVESGKEVERGGEGSSCCCLSASDSVRGSNLSCDIVTYL